jgi:hypothetical protein
MGGRGGRWVTGDGCRVPNDGCEQKAECKTESGGGAEGGGAGARWCCGTAAVVLGAAATAAERQGQTQLERYLC